MKRRIRLLVAAALAIFICISAAAWAQRATAADEPRSPSIADKPFGNTGIEECRAAAAAERDKLASGIMPRAIQVDIGQNTTMNADAGYNGDSQVEADAELDLNGHTLTVNGNLVILGTVHVDNGSLIVNGNITINGGLLLMTEASSHVTVSGKFVTAGRDSTGKMTAGTLEVRGDFAQYSVYSDKAFCPSGSFITKLTGSTASRLVYFDSPNASWFGNYDFTGTFKATSVFSMKLSLSSAAQLALPHLYIQGFLNGKALTVPGNTVVSGSLTPGGGSLNVGGPLLVDANGGIAMYNPADQVVVDGNFETGGLCDCRAGRLEIHGNFTQFGLVSGFRDNSYVGLPAHVTKIVGADRRVRFDSPATSYFGQLDCTDATLTDDSTLSLNCNLTTDEAWACSDLYYGGNLNGHNFTTSGNLFARQITLGGGSLTVEHNFTSAANNCLTMTNPADYVLVKGDFIASCAMDPGSITAGTLEIRGNFSQMRNASAFIASGTHRTILSGANKLVTFANPGQSWFNGVALAGGATFAPGSVLSMKCNLAGDASLEVPTLYYSGSLGGHTLAVNGALHIFGDTNPAGGTLSATGDVSLDGTLTMAGGTDRLECGGAFTGAGVASLSAGTSEYKKSFHYSGASFSCTGSHVATLSGGAAMPVIFDHPAQGWFSAVAIAPGTALSPGSVLSVKAAGSADMALTVPRLYLQGNLGGRSLSLTGSLTVPPGTSLAIGGGSLAVSGSMLLDNATLEMTNTADRVTVGGTFTAGGQDETGKLTNGKLTIRGDFMQSAAYSAKSFACSGAHATLFTGMSEQRVYFASPGAASGSAFAKLYVMNSAVIFQTPFYYTSMLTTSADLKTLTGTGGQLVPAFSPEIKNYIYVLPKGSVSTTLTATVEFQNMTLNGNAATSLTLPVSGVPYGGAVAETIAVGAMDGIAENTYTIKVEQLNFDLGSIGLSAGSLNPAFDPGTYHYSVVIPASAEKLTISPHPANPDASVAIAGQAAASGEYALNPGEAALAAIAVTGQDGVSTRTYSLDIARDAMLTGIEASTGTMNFASQSPAASLDIGADQPTVTIMPHAAAGCSFTIDGSAQPTATYALTPGEQKTAVIEATAGTTHFTYTVAVRRLPVLSGFLRTPIADAVLSPAFDPAGGAFTLTVPASVVNINVMPQRADCTRLTIDGAVTDSEMLQLAPGESRTLAIEAEKGQLKVTFSLTVVKRPIITNLMLSVGTLSPAFSPTLLSYTADLPATSGPVYVTPVLSSGTATVNGTAWSAASPVRLNPMPGADGTFTVTCTDGAAVTYTITVRRQRPLSSITLSAGALTPPFEAVTPEYIVSLPADKASVTVTPVKTAQCTGLAINGAARDSIVLTPAIGGAAVAEIRATGQDGATATTYTVRVVREALLSDIGLSTGSLSPSFDGGKLNYSVYLPNTAASVTISPAKSAHCRSFKINGARVSKVVLRPAAGGSATATIVAVGATDSLTQTYKVTVYRISPVTGFKLSAGRLSSSFSMAKTAYTVSVPATVSSVTLTPLKGASCKSVTINGIAAASATLTPPIGGSATATVAATAVNGHVYTYTVTVSRAALLKGIALSCGSLTPSYRATATSYTITLPSEATGVKITPLKASGVKSMAINGKAASSVTLSPVVGGSAKATIVLTASDGITKQTCIITVYWQNSPVG